MKGLIPLHLILISSYKAFVRHWYKTTYWLYLLFIQKVVSKEKPNNYSIKYLIPLFLFFILSACSSPFIQTHPAEFNDTSTLKITCDASKGNKGLKDFEGPVFVHLGLITDSSINSNEWRYVKFNWGSTDSNAKAIPVGKNKWSYTIPNIRKFFGVADEERIINIAILYRSGNCIDTFCKVLRNNDQSDIFIPLATP